MMSRRVQGAIVGLTCAAGAAVGAGEADGGIRFLDLAGESARQNVVDREPGQYLGHPTTVLLRDGHTMLAVYPKGHGRGPIVLKRSEDAGLTWSDRLPTPASWETSLETPTMYLVPDRSADGERLVLFSGLYPIRMASSADGGQTWTELAPIGDYGGIVAMGSVEPLAGGRLGAWFHDDGRFFRAEGQQTSTMTLFQVESRDGGRTWGEPRTLWASSQVHLCEPGVFRSPDGAELAMLLRENRRRKLSHIMYSSDEAESWSEPVEVTASLTGDRHVAKYAPDGRLFISFRDTAPGSPTQGDWVAWVGTYEDVKRGREGQYRVRLMDNHHQWDCAYPGVEVLPDGTIVTTTYGHWAEGEEPYIVSVRLTLGELDAMARAGEAQPQSEIKR